MKRNQYPYLMLSVILGIGVSSAVDDLLSYFYTFVRDDVREKLEAKERERTFVIENAEDVLVEETDFYYLLVRYGNNEQIQQDTLVDDERRNIQNREMPVFEEYDGEDLELTLPLKVHPRLGTEFKLFTDVSDEEYVDEIKTCLENRNWIADASVSDANSQRIFILIDELPESTSPEGFRNNFIPSNP